MPPTSPEADQTDEPAMQSAVEDDAGTSRTSLVMSELKAGLARILSPGAVEPATTAGPAPMTGPAAATGGGSADVSIRIVEPENDAEGLARVLSAQPPLFEVLLGHDGDDAMARHRLEYQEPSIWMWRRIVGASFAFIVATVTWYLIKVPSGLIGDEALPTLTQAATAFNELRADGFAGESLLDHLGASLFRLIVGLSLGAVLGVGLGLLSGAAPLIRTVVDPISSFFRMVPALALGPLAIIWFGVGETATIAVVSFSVMWLVMGAVSDTRTRLLRGSRLDLLVEIIVTMRTALLLAWVTVLAVETIVSSTGLGPMIWSAQDRSDVAVVGICLAGFVGFALDTLVRAFEYTLVNKT